MRNSTNHTDFFDKVFQVARLVPYGRVTSYGAIAEYLGMKSGARMVGWAMHGAPTQQDAVPAHRVVNSKGLLTGKIHFGSPTMMQQLLEAEGITIKNDQVQNFSTHFWDPRTELAL
jgi:methylated-DNA-protein-cysteine methyltransferase related protein